MRKLTAIRYLFIPIYNMNLYLLAIIFIYPGIEDPSPTPVPRYLSKQLEYLNEHEKLIQSYVPRLTQSQNTHALRILSEQLFLLKVCHISSIFIILFFLIKSTPRYLFIY